LNVFYYGGYFMGIKVCVVCGSEFVANSNSQKYCSVCKDDATASVARKGSQRRRAKRAFLDKRPNSCLGPNLPKSADGKVDWEAEARKVKNEKKRTYRNYGPSYAAEDRSQAARQEALESLTFDPRDDDWSGSIDDFFAGKDDK
jgi:hypothetical protein